jgi:signal transduction histidine kinase
VAATDIARRRIERDLHDGAPQRLVRLALQLQSAYATVPPAAEELADQLERLATELTSVLDELREMAHRIHPTVLTEGGLRPAMKAFARRSASRSAWMSAYSDGCPNRSRSRTTMSWPRR